MRAARAAAIPILVALAPLMPAAEGRAQGRVPTPAVVEYNLGADTPEGVTVGFGARLPDGTRVGAVVACLHATRQVELAMFFGPYPRSRPVQAAVRAPDGRIERFGGVERGSPRTGLHSPVFRDPPTVRRFIDAALVPGSLISNGHNSVWHRVPAARAAEARRALLSCSGEAP